MKTATFGVVVILSAALLSCGISADDSLMSADISDAYSAVMSDDPGVDAESTSVAKLKRKFAANERTSAQLAQQLRTAQKSLPEGHPEVRTLRSRLQSSVAAAFAVRQQLHRAQLEEFRRRMERIEQFVDSRERVRQAIIDRRVEELLNPDLKWPAAPSGSKVGPDVSGPGPGASYPKDSGATVSPNQITKSADRTPSPDEAVVWIEAVFGATYSDGKKELVTVYMNGTVIRADGLIATVFPEGVESSDMFKSATVFYSGFSIGNQHAIATLKAHDTATGVALLQADAADMPFVELSNESISINKELALRVASTSYSSVWGAVATQLYRARVSRTDENADQPPARFMITAQPSLKGDEASRAGAALTSMSGRLQGLLAPPPEHRAAPETVGPEGTVPAPREPEHPAVSVDVIRRLLDELNQSHSHAESSQRANPNQATANASQTSVQRTRSAPSDEAVVWIETVFEIESSDGKKELVTAYLNGTMIRPDGLIATVFPDGVTSSEMFKSGNVFVGYRLHAPVSLKAHDAATGVALLQIDGESLRSLDVEPAFLELSNQEVGINRRLVWKNATLRASDPQFEGRDRLTTIWHDQESVKVTGLLLDSGDAPRRFRFVSEERRRGIRDEDAGSPLISYSGRLQGLVVGTASGSARSGTVGPGGSEMSSRRDDYAGVSADVIRRLMKLAGIEQYKAEFRHNTTHDNSGTSPSRSAKLPTVEELAVRRANVEVAVPKGAPPESYSTGPFLTVLGVVPDGPVPIVDFEIQRQQFMEGLVDSDSARWTVLDVARAVKVLGAAKDFVPEIISQEFANPTITMPLPEPLKGEWDEAAVHPSLRGRKPVSGEKRGMFRFVDFTTKPGWSYRYRVRLKFADPIDPDNPINGPFSETTNEMQIDALWDK